MAVMTAAIARFILQPDSGEALLERKPGGRVAAHA